jgi:hypothetical protein
MKKEDIIGQKLFETCNLSKFYLNLIVNSKLEDDCPLQLSAAYKLKLEEIVERYDRLLENSRQREQLSLQFDSSIQLTPQINLKPSNTTTSNLNSAKPSTPCLLHNSPTTLLNRTSTPSKCYQSATAPNSCASTPIITPSHSFMRSPMASNYSLNKSRTNLSKLKHSNRLHQRLTAIFYDDFHDENSYSKANRTLNATFDQTMNEDESFLNSDQALNQSTPATTAAAIEKSYSNLSKDSGVLVDSYYSDCCSTNTNNSNRTLNQEDHLTKVQKNETSFETVVVNTNVNGDESGVDNLSSPQLSSNGTSNDTADLDEDYEVNQSRNSTEQLDNNQQSTENDEMPHFKPNELTEKFRMKKGISNTAYYRTFELHQYHHAPRIIRGFNPNQFKPSLETENKPKVFRTLNKHAQLPSKYESDASNENNYMSLMIEDASSRSPNNTKLLNQTISEQHEFITNGNETISTISPSSTSSSSSTANEIDEPFKRIDSKNSSQFNPQATTHSQQKEPSSPNALSFSLNCNSMMNMSMLENIQATNTNLEFDSMNTSILMFN